MESKYTCGLREWNPHDAYTSEVVTNKKLELGCLFSLFREI